MPFGGLLTVGLIAGGTGLAGSLISSSGANKAARAQGDIAAAQLEAEKARLEMARQQRADALEASKPSQSEIDTLMAQSNAAARAIARQEALLNATDPALIEAGAQALKLLRGEEASVLAPARAERDRQRSQLINEIQKRLGPGGLDSSSGQAALNRFDQQTQLTLGDLQQKALDRVLGVTQAVRPNPYAAADAVQQEYINRANLANRKVSAINQTPIAPYAPMQNVGASFVEAAKQGQNQQAFGQSLGQLGGDFSRLLLSSGALNRTQPTAPATNTTYGGMFSDLQSPASTRLFEQQGINGGDYLFG